MCKKCCCDICTCVSRQHSCIPYEKHVVIPFQGQSTMKDAYKAWDINKNPHNSSNKQKATQMHIRKMKFDATSNYKDEFTPKAFDREHINSLNHPSIKANYAPNPIKFDASSSYATQFTPKEIPKRPRTSYGNKGSENQYMGHKFDARSLYKDEYTAKALTQPIKSFAPRPQTAASQTHGPKFEGVTSYQSEFVRKPLQKKSNEKNINLIRNHEKYGLPFDGTSTYKINYTPKVSDANRPCPVVTNKLDRKALKDQRHRYYKQLDNKWVNP